MTASEIKDICLKGSEKYYEYLASKPNGGVEEVEIAHLEPIDNATYKLKITRKLFDPESVCLRYNGKEYKTFTSEDFQIKVYDNDKKVVVIKAKEQLQKYLSDLDSNNWKLIIDLKFLVQRVSDWYNERGARLLFNSGKLPNNTFDKSVILKGDEPSSEQLGALEMIFSEWFSYVWGAPGTGKTRFVLSYSLLHYIKKDKKVLVLAPTNVALEQILSGILEVTDKAGLERTKMLRLGYPSQEFANAYGEICEIQGIEKELKKLEEQIKIISSILGINSEKENEYINIIAQIEKAITLFIEVQKLTDELGKIGSDIYSETTRFEKLKIFLSTLETEKQIILKKKNSAIGKVLDFLSSKIDYEKELELIIDKELNAKEQLKTLDPSLGKLGVRKKETEIKKEKVLRQLEKIQFLLEENYNIDAASKAELQNALVEKKRQLAEERDQNKIYTSLAKEYENYGEDQLKLILAGLIEEKEKLDGYSIESRIENANVIASTIDTFLHRFRDKDLPIYHIFIDEAGYASIVKALTVFTYKCPVTLLGDHKQLPPVCEISKADIQKDRENSEVFVWDQSAIYIGDLWAASDLKDALDTYFNSLNPSFKNLIKSSLTQSYRFGPNLATVLDKFVYDTGFRSMRKEDTEVIIFNVSNPAQARGKGRLNQAEAYAIQELVQTSYNGNEEVAVLAPYRAQVKMIQNLIPEFKDENKILTVHKSQGREWDTVIYSVCDIGNDRRPWFTDTQSKISNGLNNVNTAVSRAKKQLILFCCIDEWSSIENQLITGIINARTRRVDVDSSRYSYKSNSSFGLWQSKKQSVSGLLRLPNQVDITSSKTWESKTLYWSKEKKPGYRYSDKKQAWWKRK